MEKTLRQSLAAIATAFTEATGIAASTASKRAVNDQMFIGRVIEGGGFTIRTYDRAVQWFADNWPKHAVWPEGVERPEPTVEGAAA